jgi:glycosyltransferase involved in cell wall biosynthesis
MKKACMIVYSYFPDDPRVRREAEALIDAGWIVDIICLRNQQEPALEPYGQAWIYRLPGAKQRGQGVSKYLTEYTRFFVLASTRLAALHLRRRYDLVQVHNMPDFLVFTAWLPKMLGSRVILDIHDLVPELYTAKFLGKPNHPIVRVMKWSERRSASFAHHVITVGESFRRQLAVRSVPPEKLTVVMNSADTKLFHAPPTPTPKNGGFHLVYHGGVFERYGLDVAVRAVAMIGAQIPGLRFDIYGGGDALDDVQKLVQTLGVGDIVHMTGQIPLSQVPARIAGADLGVVPYRRNVFTEMLYPTKAFEYIVMGIPVIMSRIPAMAELFGDIPDLFVAPDDVGALAAHILALYHAPERLSTLLDAERSVYAPLAWESQRQKYVSLVHQLTKTQPA